MISPAKSRATNGLVAALCVLGLLVGCTDTTETLKQKPEPGTAAKPKPGTDAKPGTKAGTIAEDTGPPTVLSTLPVGKWTPIFDGKTLRGWRVPTEDEFEMHGEVNIKKGAIHTGVGMPFSGIVWTGDLPNENYEVELEAMRTTGVDIFCGLTFPVGKDCVSLICGGWGDTVVGISSIDDMNASENDSTKVMSFDNNKWYRIRVRVTTDKIETWIADKPVIELEREGHRFSLYGGVEPVSPLGIFSWQSEGAVRNIRFRRVAAPRKRE